MRTHEASNETTFHYNSDFSGAVNITTPSGARVDIPAQDILEFVADCYIRGRRISHAESAEWQDLYTRAIEQP